MQEALTADLFAAVEANDPVRVLNCCRMGGLRHLKDRFGRTRSALHIAIDKEHRRVFDVLVNYTSDIELLDDNEETPLIAAARKQGPYVRELVRRGANVNATFSCTKPLLEALGAQQVDNANYLIQRGANISLKESRYLPILYDCAEYVRFPPNSVDFTSLLLDAGCDTEILYCGQTALEHAVSINNTGFVSAFQEHFRAWNRRGHDRLLEVALVFGPLCLPDYVLMWILDWLNEFKNRPEFNKILLLQRVRLSRRRALTGRLLLAAPQAPKK